MWHMVIWVLNAVIFSSIAPSVAVFPYTSTCSTKLILDPLHAFLSFPATYVFCSVANDKAPLLDSATPNPSA